ncbi:hypothetical protein [Rhodococcus sp. SJ-2]
MTANRKWHPWRHLRDHHPHIDVTFADLTAHGLLGRITHRGIDIEQSCDQRERRSTLTHETIHLERGPVPRHPHFAQREERVVEELTARRMITLIELVDVIAWCQGRTDDEAAEELWVELDVLQTRIDTLTLGERAWVERQIARRCH